MHTVVQELTGASSAPSTHPSLTVPASSTPFAAPPTPDQVRLIQSTWLDLKPAGEQVGLLFYQRLFEIDPGLRPMFSRDLVPQARKLVAMLSAVIDGLERLDALLPRVAALGRRHAGYGVQPAHYRTVGQALIWTLRRGLGPSASEPVIGAWTAAYALLADAMQTAATQHDAAIDCASVERPAQAAA